MSRKILFSIEDTIPEKNYQIHQIDLSKLLGLNIATRVTTIATLADVFGMQINAIDEEQLRGGSMTMYTKEQINDYYESAINVLLKLYILINGCTSDPKYKDNNIVSAREYICTSLGCKTTYNCSNVRLGEQVSLIQYCRQENIQFGNIKPERSIEKFKCVNAIPDSVVFEYDKFIGYRNYLSELSLDEDGKINYSFPLQNILVSCGNGGMHACCESGIYESDSNHTIVSCDITSYYASVIRYLRLHPSHLTEHFVDAVENILEFRLWILENYPENKAVSDMLKGMLVGIYGKFNEKQSLLYDWTLQKKVTIAAQLFTLYWVELVMKQCDVEFLAINTDAFICKINNDDLEKLRIINNLFFGLYKFKVKSDFISKLFIKDVNNYMFIDVNGKVKRTGCFDCDLNIYKSSSTRKVASILNDYFFNNIEPSESLSKYDKKYIKDATNIIYQIKTTQLSLF